MSYGSAADFLQYKHSIEALRKHPGSIGIAVMVPTSPDFNLVVLKSLIKESFMKMLLS
jgi:hypothetical protein